MPEFRNKIPAYSLAETLVTLLIVCILALVSVPMLAKKKSDPSKIHVHGKWTCVLDSNNWHESRLEINGSTTFSRDYNSCSFSAPTNAKDFVVKIIGGGGGGAAGTKPEIKSYYGTTTFRVPDTASYIVAVVGGGGCGGTYSSICKTYEERKTGGGGSGGYQLQTLRLMKNTSCSVSIGSSGGVNEKAGTSKFSCGGYNLIAEGGNSGRSKVEWKKDGGASHSDKYYCDWTPDNKVNDGSGGYPSGSNGSVGSYGYSYYAGTISNSRVCRFTTGSNSNCYYGRGGSPGYRGSNGIVTLTKTEVGAGGAGGPGATVIRVFPSLKDVKVTLGRGGTGGYVNDRSGTAGTTTVFKHGNKMVTAIGGIGGETKYATAEESTVKGQNAVTPEVTTTEAAARSYGGFTLNNEASANATRADYIRNTAAGAGSGGSGGGASMDTWGRGADGNPGAVIIEW